MDHERRIQQFKQMAEADPNNELGHFSLGKAYLEAGLPKDAVGPLTRALQLNPSLSRAYQVLGQAQDAAGDRKAAVETFTRGVTVADEQGDRMPRDAMADLLRSWGESVPAFKAAAGPQAVTESGTSAAGFQCSRCGRPDDQLPKPPFKGPLGQKIYENVCRNCWREWVPMGTKVINELGLVLSTSIGQQSYDQYMVEFLQLEGR
jgi:Fe-S cluster biosynthesis and repair protein YggX